MGNETGEGEGGEGSGIGVRAFEWGRVGESRSEIPPNKAADAEQGTRRISYFDPVTRPSHYASAAVECIDAIRAQLSEEEFRGFLRGQVAKYNWRLTKKGKQSEDAGKLLFYAKLLNGIDPREED